MDIAYGSGEEWLKFDELIERHGEMDIGGLVVWRKGRDIGRESPRVGPYMVVIATWESGTYFMADLRSGRLASVLNEDRYQEIQCHLRFGPDREA